MFAHNRSGKGDASGAYTQSDSPGGRTGGRRLMSAIALLGLATHGPRLRRCLKPRDIGGQGVQLSHQAHPAHPPSSDDRTGAHSGVQPDTVSAGLLQRCVARSSSQQYSEAAARAEHCGACRSAERQTITISATPPAAVLAPGSTTDRLQTGRPDVQDPPHFHPGLRTQPSHPASHRHSSASLFCKPTTKINFADHAFCCSAPAVWNSLTTDIVDSSSVPVFKRKLKTFLFRRAFSSS